jgi:hypothetical protein
LLDVAAFLSALGLITGALAGDLAISFFYELAAFPFGVDVPPFF